MSHPLSAHFSFLPSIYDDDDDDDDYSPIDSTHPTPRASFLFLFDTSDPQYDDSPRRRPHSLFSVDSGYFSMMGKESPLSRSFSRKPSRADLRPPLPPVNSATDPNYPKREGVIRSLLRKKKRSMTSSFPPDLDPFTLGVSRRIPADPVRHLRQSRSFSFPSPRSSLCDPFVDTFERQDRFVLRRGMKHHPYSRGDAPYMLSYDRTLLDKYVSFPNLVVYSLTLV